jgi:hypothetical protein
LLITGFHYYQTKDSVKTNFNRLNRIFKKTPNLSGKVITYDGRESTGLLWNSSFRKEKEKKNENKLNTVVPVSFPNIAFGNTAKLNKKPYF